MKKMTKALGIAAVVAASLSVSAFAEDVFTIGGIGPMTGGAALYGTAVMNAAQIAVDEINAAGGVNGMTLQFIPQDDEHNAEKAVNAYNALKDQDMKALLGTVTSAPCIAVKSEAVADNMFLLTPSGTAVDCISDADNAFRVCFSDPNQGTASATYIKDNMPDIKKVGIIYDSSDPYSAGITNTFRMQAAADGAFEVVESAIQAFTADSKTDFSAQIQACKDAEVDLVFMPFYYTEASVVLTQASKIEFNPIWFGVDGMDGILGVEGFDTSLAEGLMLLTPFVANADDDATKAFVAEYESRFGETPIQFAADAYDGIYIMKACMEASGVTADMSAAEVGDAMKAAMLEVTVDGLTGAGMTWDVSGEPTKAPKAAVIENGEYKLM